MSPPPPHHHHHHHLFFRALIEVDDGVDLIVRLAPRRAFAAHQLNGAVEQAGQCRCLRLRGLKRPQRKMQNRKLPKAGTASPHSCQWREKVGRRANGWGAPLK